MKHTELSAFKQAILTGGSCPASVLVLASEDFDRREATTATLQAAAGAGGGEVLRYQGESVQLGVLATELNSLSFFGERRVLLIDNIDKLKKPVLEALVNYLVNPNAALVLVLVGTTLRSNGRLYKEALKAGVVFHAPDEKPWQKEKRLVGWLEGQARVRGKTLRREAASYILQQLGTDMMLLASELDKLVCYVGERPEITVQDAGTLCTQVNLQTVWQLGDAIMGCDTASAVGIGKALLDDGVAIYSIVSQIRSQLQTGFKVCSILNHGGNEGDVSKEIPYLRGRILSQKCQLTRGYGMPRFHQALIQTNNTDILSKNSQITAHTLLTLLLTKITR